MVGDEILSSIHHSLEIQIDLWWACILGFMFFFGGGFLGVCLRVNYLTKYKMLIFLVEGNFVYKMFN